MSNRNKAKGSKFEQQVVDWLNEAFDTDEFERLVIGGANDRGDVGWLRTHGKKVVIEAKNHRRSEIPKWLEEAEKERGNADAVAKVVFSKRRGIGPKNFGRTYVFMEARDLIALLTGERMEE